MAGNDGLAMWRELGAAAAASIGGTLVGTMLLIVTIYLGGG